MTEPVAANGDCNGHGDEQLAEELNKVNLVWDEITAGQWRKEASMDLASLVSAQGILILDRHSLLDRTKEALDNGSEPTAREGACHFLSALAEVVGKSVEPYLVPFIPAVLERLADKVPNVRSAAENALTALMPIISPYAVPAILPVLIAGLAVERKWQTKEGAVKAIHALCPLAPKQITTALPDIIPPLSDCMTDARSEVKKASWDAAVDLFQLMGNKDIEPTVPDILQSMADPKLVANTITNLSATRFVQPIEAPALAVMVPLLLKGLREETPIKRKTAVIIANMSKLVTNPLSASCFLPKLLPRLEQVSAEAADPELRSVATMAQSTVARIAHDSEEAAKEMEAATAHRDPQVLLSSLKTIVASNTKVSKLPEFSAPSLDYVVAIAIRLMDNNVFEVDEWDAQCVTPYLSVFMTEVEAERVCRLFMKCCQDMVRGGQDDDEDDGEGEDLCNCQFSLAYGGKILLTNARLRLKRGRRYGLCGANGVGKSTLMRAINSGQLDGFPPKDVLRTVYVEHDIDASLSEVPVVEFVANDPLLKGMKTPPTMEQVTAMLTSVGFTDVMQASPLVSLSGGWKMKLALARAMLSHPDILLLDEPTNHLDVANVKWLEDYLNVLASVTSLIVSHDSGFLDNVCTDIIHYEQRKLKRYHGNLSEFVKAVPAAQTYYELEAAQLKFRFPVPTFLDGVTSNEKPILQMKKVTFTYPSRELPTLVDVTCACRLGSRVAVLGVNGAGKSTLIKILTGELRPQDGKVIKHPNVRVAYVAQHAFHHIEEHLDKSPNQYLRRRFQTGEDLEEQEKVTRKITKEEEERIMKQIWNIDGQPRVLDKLLGRRKKKRSFEYEVKWVGLDSLKFNRWIPREELEAKGYTKLINEVDGKLAASAGGVDTRPLTQLSIEAYLSDFGLDPEFGTHSAIRGLSGGQKVKLVLAAAMWSNPHLLVMDEPTNYLDRESLGALANAIKEFKGGVIIISHHAEFTSTICNEVWHMAGGRLKVVENVFTAEEHAKLVMSMVNAPGAGAEKKEE